MSITFLHPLVAWLWLLLPPLWWWARRRVGAVHALLRTLLFACVIGAAAQPSLVHRDGAVRQVFVLDQRDGLDAAARTQARTALAQRLARVPAGDRTTLVQLGGAPVAARVDQRVILPGDAAGDSLAQALARALEAIPLGSAGRITLISDGRSRDRHWARSLDALTRRGIAVDTLRLPLAQPAAFLGAVQLAPARAGEAVRATVQVEGRGRDLTVALYAGARPLALSPAFDVDGHRALTLSFPAGPAGFLPVHAVLAPAGHATADAPGLDTVAAIQSPLPVLYLGARQADALAPLQRLLGPGFAVEQRRPDTLDEAFDFTRYRAVMLDDVPAAQLPDAVQRRLAATVAGQGVGLLYSGGQAAFGAGGYAGSALAPLLPVTIRQDQQVQQPSVALAIVIDTSGSMQGQPLDLAKQVARLAVRKLGPADSVGVVEFYGARQWAVPMQSAKHTADIERAIGRMQAQGASVLFPAVQEAYYGLKNVDARFKHILVISDAGVEEERYEQLLRHIAGDRINVSTALVGSTRDGEERMAQWARWGRGRYYAIADEFSLVQLDLKQPQIKPEAGYRPGDFALRVQDGRGWWPGLDPAALPSLHGLARAEPRPQAQTLLTTGAGDPVLASWPYGAGQVTALMTEPLGQGTQGWQRWPGYGQWLGQILARTAAPQPDWDLQMQREGARLRIVAQRLAGDPTQPPVLRLGARADAADAAPVAAERKAPGLYVATLEYPSTHPALLELRDGAQVWRGADRAGSDLLPGGRLDGAPALPLAGLSRLTGGVHADAATAGTTVIPRGRTGDLLASALWPWLALLALLLYLAELAYRRWPTRRAGG